MDKQDNKYRVLVVDDSAFMRKVVSTILSSDSETEVVGTANDGKHALEMIDATNPDVITLDIEMPVMNGIECLKIIVEKYNIPVLMISSHTKVGAECTIEALDCGAIDFISKPEDIMEMNSFERRQELLEKVKIAAKINKKITKLGQFVPKTEEKLKKIIAIGSSTGGPKALKQIINSFPQDLEAAVLVVQHMPPGFTKSLAIRLNNTSKVLVKEAEENEKIKNGCVYIAPGGYHMLVNNSNNNYKIKLTKDPPVGRLRPTIDKMMISVAESDIEIVCGVILTGMGSDGSKGIIELKEKAKAHIIVQDEETSTVYGMPRMAFKTGAVDDILPIDKIADEIINQVRRGK